MFTDEYAHNQLQHIVSGTSIAEPKSTLHATRNYLCASFETSTTIKKDFDHQQEVKKEQKQVLVSFAESQNLFIDIITDERYLTQGGEASVYFSKDNTHVIKINDGVYYNTWLDFLNSLCLHNLFFPATSYELLGFTKSNEFCAVVKQNFILSNQPVDLAEVETILNANGFEKIRKLDYYNKHLGIVLEDMHDQNVIKQNDIYFFIDTVFYLNV